MVKLVKKVQEENKINFNEIGLTEVLILAHPFYDWVDNNIENIKYKLLKAVITNIVPLGDSGRKFFGEVIKKRKGFSQEFLNIYNHIEQKYKEGKMSPSSYLQLISKGYSGEVFDGKCPVDDIVKYQKIKISIKRKKDKDGNILAKIDEFIHE